MQAGSPVCGGGGAWVGMARDAPCSRARNRPCVRRRVVSPMRAHTRTRTPPRLRLRLRPDAMDGDVAAIEAWMMQAVQTQAALDPFELELDQGAVTPGGGSLSLMYDGTALLETIAQADGMATPESPQMKAEDGGEASVDGLLLITDQPSQFARFRYRSEGRNAPLRGRQRAPTVQLSPGARGQIHGSATVSAALVLATPDEFGTYQQHPYELVGTTTQTLSAQHPSACFDDLSVLVTGRQEGGGARSQANRRAARLAFRLQCYDHTGAALQYQVISEPFYNGSLAIQRLSQASGPATGGNEVYLLCTKVRKGTTSILICDETVQLNEWPPADGTWHPVAGGEALLIPPTQLYLHYQVTVVFRMPSCDVDPSMGRRCMSIRLVDTQDYTESAPTQYTYVLSDSARRQQAAHRKRQYMDEDRARYQRWRSSYLDRPAGGGAGTGSSPGGPANGRQCAQDAAAEADALDRGGADTTAGADADAGVAAAAIRLFAASGDARFLCAAYAPLITAPDEHGNTPLHTAAAGTDVACLDALLEFARPGDVDRMNDDGDTCLHIAVRHGHAAILQRLVSLDANVLLADANGDTAVHIACRGTDDDALGALLFRPSASPEYALRLARALACYNNDGLLPVHVCAAGGPDRSTMLAMLLHAGADANARDRCGGQTALHYCARLQDVDGAKLLVAHKANVNSRDGTGSTPLHLANGGAVARVLLAAGAKPNVVNLAGDVPVACTDSPVSTPPAAPSPPASAAQRVAESTAQSHESDSEDYTKEITDDDYVVIDRRACQLMVKPQDLGLGSRWRSGSSRTRPSESGSSAASAGLSVISQLMPRRMTRSAYTVRPKDTEVADALLSAAVTASMMDETPSAEPMATDNATVPHLLSID